MVFDEKKHSEQEDRFRRAAQNEKLQSGLSRTHTLESIVRYP